MAATDAGGWMRSKVRMKPQDDGMCPWSMTGPRRALRFRHVLGASESSAFDQGRWISDESSRYSACLHATHLHVWDSHLGTCLYELVLERARGPELHINSAFVLDDAERYRRCDDDQDESARLTKILRALFCRRG